jgi:hypothetical protein
MHGRPAMTSHRKPKISRWRYMRRLPYFYIPPLRTLFGCTSDGRILWVKTGWYMDEKLSGEER